MDRQPSARAFRGACAVRGGGPEVRRCRQAARSCLLSGDYAVSIMDEGGASVVGTTIPRGSQDRDRDLGHGELGVWAQVGAVPGPEVLASVDPEGKRFPASSTTVRPWWIVLAGVGVDACAQSRTCRRSKRPSQMNVLCTPNEGPGLEVHRLFRLVREVLATIRSLRRLSVRVVRISHCLFDSVFFRLRSRTHRLRTRVAIDRDEASLEPILCGNVGAVWAIEVPGMPVVCPTCSGQCTRYASAVGFGPVLAGRQTTPAAATRVVLPDGAATAPGTSVLWPSCLKVTPARGAWLVPQAQRHSRKEGSASSREHEACGRGLRTCGETREAASRRAKIH